MMKYIISFATLLSLTFSAVAFAATPSYYVEKGAEQQQGFFKRTFKKFFKKTKKTSPRAQKQITPPLAPPPLQQKSAAIPPSTSSGQAAKPAIPPTIPKTRTIPATPAIPAKKIAPPVAAPAPIVVPAPIVTPQAAPTPVAPAPVSASAPQTPATHAVTYENNLFTPAVVNAKIGDIVAFKNNHTFQIRVSSNPHPIHTSAPELESDTLPVGDTYRFTTTKQTTIHYHNHFNPGAEGTIVVE